MIEGLDDKLSALAHLETIRSARIEPLKLRINKKAGLSTSSEVIRLPRLRPGRIHVITSICLIEIGSGTPQVFLGIMSDDVKYYLFSDTVTTAEDAVIWGGQCIALDGDEIFAELQGATAADEAILTAYGYSMRL
jgi:hypothetical protein